MVGRKGEKEAEREREKKSGGAERGVRRKKWREKKRGIKGQKEGEIISRGEGGRDTEEEGR